VTEGLTLSTTDEALLYLDREKTLTILKNPALAACPYTAIDQNEGVTYADGQAARDACILEWRTLVTSCY